MTAEARGRRGRSLRLLGPALLAFALTLAYAWWLAPAWEPAASDQIQYLALARGLVERGEYTRAPVGEAFVPEPLRTPGYPLFLAPLCLGGCDHWRIALVQGALYTGLILLAYRLATAVLPRRLAVPAIVLVALYLPLAYSAALALSDFLSAFLLVASLAAYLRARRQSSIGWGAATGALLGWLALTRATYLLLPVTLVLVALVVERTRVVRARSAAPLVAVLVAFVLVLTPFFAYSARYFGGPFASSSGSALWLGAIQGLAESDLDDFERGELAAVRAEVVAFDRIRDRLPQSYAWVALNAKLGEHGRRFIAHDPVGYLARAPLRAVVLWAGDLPVPQRAVAGLPTAVRVLAEAAELALFAFAVAGAIALARRGGDAGLLALAVLLYVSAVGIPLGTEARYALAAKPVVIVAALAGLSALRRAPARGAIP